MRSAARRRPRNESREGVRRATSARRSVDGTKQGGAARAAIGKDRKHGSRGGRESERWWGEADSNRRRLSHQIYSLARLAAPESPRTVVGPSRGRTRRVRRK